MPRIPALPDFAGTVASDDELPLYDTSADLTYGVTIAQIATAVQTITTGIAEAPTDGGQYVRRNSAWERQDDCFLVAVSDETTAITTGTAKITFHWPFAFTLSEVMAGVATVSSSGVVRADVNKAGVSIFSTRVSIDASEETSLTAATAQVLTTTAFAKGDKCTVDIDDAGTGATGLKLYFIGKRA